MSNKNFLDIIKKQRKAKKAKKFKGTFLEYLEIVRDNPNIIKLSHRRLYDTIKDYGLRTVDIDNESRH